MRIAELEDQKAAVPQGPAPQARLEIPRLRELAQQHQPRETHMLTTDPQARVLDARGAPTPDLYARGNDMNSIMTSAYAGAGITLGPALSFGYIARRELARG